MLFLVFHNISRASHHISLHYLSNWCLDRAIGADQFWPRLGLLALHWISRYQFGHRSHRSQLLSESLDRRLCFRYGRIRRSLMVLERWIRITGIMGDCSPSRNRKDREVKHLIYPSWSSSRQQIRFERCSLEPFRALRLEMCWLLR